jgi:putative phosphoribosyl transferase
VYVARKVGAPGHEELGIGAVAEGLDQPVISGTAQELGIGSRDLHLLAEQARAELARRVDLYRAGQPSPEIQGKDVVLVDDGLATGVTAEAALWALRQRHPGRLILAIPVCANETAERLAQMADDLVCVERPAAFFAVGDWYEDFSQTTDQEVLNLLNQQQPI